MTRQDGLQNWMIITYISKDSPNRALGKHLDWVAEILIKFNTQLKRNWRLELLKIT
jgi:hypothetical protein